MKVQISLLLLFICSSFGFYTEGNIWFQTYKENETKAAINIFTRGRFGFTYVNIISTTLQNVTVLLYVQNNVVQLIQTSQNIPNNKTVSLISQEKVKSFGNVFNDIELKVAFPIEYLVNNSIISIGKRVKLTLRVQ